VAENPRGWRGFRVPSSDSKNLRHWVSSEKYSPPVDAQHCRIVLFSTSENAFILILNLCAANMHLMYLRYSSLCSSLSVKMTICDSSLLCRHRAYPRSPTLYLVSRAVMEYIAEMSFSSVSKTTHLELTITILFSLEDFWYAFRKTTTSANRSRVVISQSSLWRSMRRKRIIGDTGYLCVMKSIAERKRCIIWCRHSEHRECVALQIGCAIHKYAVIRAKMSETGFEPVPLARIRPERIALDHSAILTATSAAPLTSQASSRIIRMHMLPSAHLLIYYCVPVLLFRNGWV